MSRHAVPLERSDQVYRLCLIYLREPINEGPPGEDRTFVFDPDLTSEEQATFDVLLHLAASVEPMQPDAYSAVRSEMQTLRALRQMGRGAFMDLTAAERDRAMYDAFTSVTKVLLAILRDE